MSWIKWVARPDVPLKDALTTWAIGDTVEQTNIWGYPELSKLPRVRIMYLGPYVHLDRETNIPVFAALLEIFKNRNSKCYLELSEKYHKIAGQLLDYLDEFATLNLRELPNDQLLSRFDGFVERYLDYGPIINSGAAGDWLYRAEFDPFIREMSKRLRARVGAQEAELPLEVRLVISRCMGSDEEYDARVQAFLREALTFSDRKTYNEQKEDALWKLAAAIEDVPGAAPILIAGQQDGLRKEYQDLYRDLESTWGEWKWTRMWSLPPTYAPSTRKEFVEELAAKLTGNAKELYDARMNKRRADEALFHGLLNALALTARERDFIVSVNHMAYLRTWRMEVSTRATYLATPLIEEMGARLEGLESPVDIVYLAPWEIQEAWAAGRVGKVLLKLVAERKAGYAVYQRNSRPEFYSGKALALFREQLLSVTNYLESGRGQYALDASFVGGKGRNMLRLVQSKQNVPPFFVVTIEAFRAFIAHNNLEARLRQLTGQEATDADQAKLRSLFSQADLPATISAAIDEQLEALNIHQMAVRSSAAPEDAEGRSWAGRFRSIMYVDRSQLPKAIKEVWASLFDPMARRYATEVGVDLLSAGMAVVVQQMVDASVSGVANSVRSMREPDIAEIEAALGLGEGIVSGAITPDTYYVDKRNLTIEDKVISTQKIAYGTAGESILGPEGAKQKLTDDEILAVARVVKGIEAAFEEPQDIEFALKDGVIHVLQSRPQTGLSETMESPLSFGQQRPGASRGKLLATGLKGKVEALLEGTARVILTPSDGDRFKTGEILVAPVATPVWDALLYRAGAIVTDEGGATSHAIRVANERRIPAVVGTGDGARTVPDGAKVLVDTTATGSFRGKVYLIQAKP